MYVDSNVLIFAALDSGRIGADANRFLRLIREGRIRASVSPMVLNEVMRAIVLHTNHWDTILTDPPATL